VEWPVSADLECNTVAFYCFFALLLLLLLLFHPTFELSKQKEVSITALCILGRTVPSISPSQHGKTIHIYDIFTENVVNDTEIFCSCTGIITGTC
jgi:hypothetical protein